MARISNPWPASGIGQQEGSGAVTGAESNIQIELRKVTIIEKDKEGEEREEETVLDKCTESSGSYRV